jgi:hypothetical protein
MTPPTKYLVYIKGIGEPKLIASIDTLDQVWNSVIGEITAELPFWMIYELVRKPACVSKYQQHVNHLPYVIYDKPKDDVEPGDIIWIGNVGNECYYTTTRMLSLGIY